jgi:hypothetical protein
MKLIAKFELTSIKYEQTIYNRGLRYTKLHNIDVTFHRRDY